MSARNAPDEVRDPALCNAESIRKRRTAAACPRACMACSPVPATLTIADRAASAPSWRAALCQMGQYILVLHAFRACWAARTAHELYNTKRTDLRPQRHAPRARAVHGGAGDGVLQGHRRGERPAGALPPAWRVPPRPRPRRAATATGTHDRPHQLALRRPSGPQLTSALRRAIGHGQVRVERMLQDVTSAQMAQGARCVPAKQATMPCSGVK